MLGAPSRLVTTKAMASVTPPAAAAAAKPRLALIGRGCDPVRARFAEKSWSERLGVDVVTATSDHELWGKMAERRYDLFFMARARHFAVPQRVRGGADAPHGLGAQRAQAPGACQLTKEGVYTGGDVVQRVQELQARALPGPCSRCIRRTVSS
jgi:hypothetical protein